MAEDELLKRLLEGEQVRQRGNFLPVATTTWGNVVPAVPGAVMAPYQAAARFMTGANQGDVQQQIQDAMTASGAAAMGGLALGRAPAGAVASTMGGSGPKPSQKSVMQQAADMLARETERAKNIPQEQRDQMRQEAENAFAFLKSNKFPQQTKPMTQAERDALAKEPGARLAAETPLSDELLQLLLRDQRGS